jgi:hypothetical protein
VTFVAGEKVRAPSLRERLPMLGFAAADVALNQSIDVTVIPGMSVVLEPASIYAWEGILAFEAANTPKIVVTTLGLDSASGHWATWGLDDATGGTTGVGPVDARQTLGYGDRASLGFGDVFGFNLAGATGVAQSCLLCGVIATGDRGGALQVAFEQLVADAANTTVNAGSWIRAQKIMNLVR